MAAVYTPRQLQYLRAMGIPAWVERQSALKSEQAVLLETADESTLSRDPGGCGSADNFASWFSGLHAASSGRPGTFEGDPNSTLLIIEDSVVCEWGQRPFAGPVSRLFDAMLNAIELSRRSTLLGSLIPAQETAAPSEDPLGALQDKSLRAVLFFTLPKGRHGLDDLEPLREREHILDSGVPCVVSYHPAYLMNHNPLKRAAWNDLKRIRQLLD